MENLDNFGGNNALSNVASSSLLAYKKSSKGYVTHFLETKVPIYV